LGISKVSGIDLPPIVLDEKNISNICAYSVLKKEIVLVDDVYEDSEFNFSGPRAYDEITGYRTKSMLAIPLTSVTDRRGENVVAALQLINAIDRKTGEVTSFDAGDVGVMASMAEVFANTLLVLISAQDIKDLFNAFVKTMANTIDERSPYTLNHTRNVADYAGRFADYLTARSGEGHALHFDEMRKERLIMAAYLHDIGKIVVPPEILDKPTRLGARVESIRYKFALRARQDEIRFLRGALDEEEFLRVNERYAAARGLTESVNAAAFLTDEIIAEIREFTKLTYTDGDGNESPIFSEYEIDALTTRKGTLTESEREVMQSHVSITRRMLEAMSFGKYYGDVMEWAANHHETLDGKGYPQGISENEISPETRILSILDVYDALTASDRPYKKAVPHSEATSILRSMADEGQLDASLVGLFVESGISAGQNQSPERE
jgi:HD-GYP domain-containing protein (c-di-GMP phosphodiesterase class II)